MPSSVKLGMRTSVTDAMKKSTFGTGARSVSNLPKNVPGPGAYYPTKFTEANHSYSIPRAASSQAIDFKKAQAPGPQHYFNQS